jgi:hypothetical protein
MKIGFLAPINGLKQYGDVYLSIVSFLDKKGHDVIHPLSVNETILLNWNSQQRDDFFIDYYSRVNKCDLLLAECSFPCINMGYEIANAIQQGKEIIILKAKDAEMSLQNFDPMYSKKNIYIYEYLKHNLQETLEEAIAFNPSQKYKKYNILFTPHMVAKLNEIAKKKNLPKSVYIRQLLEKGLSIEE